MDLDLWVTELMIFPKWRNFGNYIESVNEAQDIHSLPALGR